MQAGGSQGPSCRKGPFGYVISDPSNATLTSSGPTQVSVIHQHRFPVLPDDDMASVMASAAPGRIILYINLFRTLLVHFCLDVLSWGMQACISKRVSSV
jgi:hypothetical protein